MNKITSIATAVPRYKHRQESLYNFANAVYENDAVEARKLRFLYRQSAIEQRYSVVPDFDSVVANRKFFGSSADLEPFPGIERRMELYSENATALSVEAISKCIYGKINPDQITHLITVSCTGMSAPGLDLLIMENMQLPSNIVRTSVNFMGCYAAIHGMKLADAFCKADSNANVVVVCTELCTLHFQKDKTIDNITSTLLFGDGCAAFLMQGTTILPGIVIDRFYSAVKFEGKKEMAWEISSKGFLMTLSGYVPELIKQDFAAFTAKALENAGIEKNSIKHWCIHPGGKKILEAISTSLEIEKESMDFSYEILRDYGNMSSATILFVLEKILLRCSADQQPNDYIFGAAFGPGLTMETFVAHYD